MPIRAYTRLVLSFLTLLLPASAFAVGGPVFDGGGLPAGLNAAQAELAGSGIIEEPNLLQVIARFIRFILPYAAALVFAVFIISGFLLILGLGYDTPIDRAKKMMFWSLIGLLVILIAYPVTSFLIGFGGP